MNTKKNNLRSWELPDPLYNALKKLVPEKTSNMGRPVSVDFRMILAGIFFVLRTGIQWQACPREKFGPPSTVHHYFNKWRREGVFEKMLIVALETYDDLKGIDWEWQSVDGAMTKAPLGGEATGPNPTDRGKQGTKRSLLTDARGTPLSVVPSAANINDFKLLESTIENIEVERPEPSGDRQQNMCLDKGYDDKRSRRTVAEKGYVPHIRSRGEEKGKKENDPDFKPRRWVVEVSHSWLNRFRKILVRFEKKVENHLALLHLACAYLVFKRCGTF